MPAPVEALSPLAFARGKRVTMFRRRHATAGLALPSPEDVFASCSSISMRWRSDSISSERVTLLLRNWMRSLKASFSGRIIEDERLRARTGVLLFLALAAGFVARQAGLRDAVDRFLHFAFVRLARDLQQQ